jgi:hypothetical protein
MGADVDDLEDDVEAVAPVRVGLARLIVDGRDVGAVADLSKEQPIVMEAGEDLMDGWRERQPYCPSSHVDRRALAS